MRKPIVAGNWKMNKTITEARELVSASVAGLNKVDGVEVILCPPFPALMAVKALLVGSEIKLGAQNMYWKKSGAYTGEVSPEMLAELCAYVILGHSERRAYFGETDQTVNLKVKAAYEFGLLPIVCVGETLEENELKQTTEVVSRQILQGLDGLILENAEELVIAYEPVWAIGTGKAATADGADSVVGDVIRPALSELFGTDAAGKIRVLYGGSVKGSNAREFFNRENIDGALVGGASLDREDFLLIAQAAG